MPQPVFYLNNWWHAGDVIFSRVIIKEIMTVYPEVTIVLGCRSSNSYLWKDFGVETVQINENEVPQGNPCPRSVEEGGEYEFDLSFTSTVIYESFCMSYSCLVHAYNSYLKDYGIYEKYHLYDRQEMPFPEFPKRNPVIHVKNRAVMVENGSVRSEQTVFDLNEYLRELTEMFPLLNFYCSATPGFTADNVIDCSGYHLIELSELSKSCIAFLTKASGVNAAATVEMNKYKPRCFALVTERLRNCWMWELPENPVVYADSKQEIIDFLSFVNRNSAMLPVHNNAMRANPEKYKIKLRDYIERVSFCKFLKTGGEIGNCIDYLNRCLLPAHSREYKNWGIAHTVSDLSDGNLLEMGNSDLYILLGALYKGVPGEKYVLDSKEPDGLLPMINYLAGSSIEDVTLPDGYFQNIACLTVSEHDTDIKKFAGEVSRLLSAGGKLYVTFDYWEPKTVQRNKPKVRQGTKLYDQDLNIWDKNDVLNLIDECESSHLELTEDIDWELGGLPVPGIDYTFGMLRFKKVV